MKVLHIVGGKLNNGAVKGAKILHEALLDQKIDSLFMNSDAKTRHDFTCALAIGIV